MITIRHIHFFPIFALSIMQAHAYDVFPGMIKPTAASPDGRYLVTTAPFAPHVVWQMPEGQPVFVASNISYNSGEVPQPSVNIPLPPVITNDGWLIISSDGGQDPIGSSPTQASNIHNGVIQTLTEKSDCTAYASGNNIVLSCLDHLESWVNQGQQWQLIAQISLPDYALGLEDIAANQHNLFGVEYSEGEFDPKTEASIAENFGIRAFDSHTLKPLFTVPFDCCIGPSFVLASGSDNFLWAEPAGSSTPSSAQNYREPVSLYQLDGDNIERIGRLTLAAYPHGASDDAYHPQLSYDGRYLSGVFVENGQTQYIYDLQDKQFLTNTPYRRGIWLGNDKYASRLGEAQGLYDSATNTPQMVAIHTFPVPENDQPVYHTLFNDLDTIVAQGKTLDSITYTHADYQPENIKNGVIARSLPDLMALIGQDNYFGGLSGRVNKQFPVSDNAVWLDITTTNYEDIQETARYLAYRIGEGNAARWAIIMRLTIEPSPTGK